MSSVIFGSLWKAVKYLWKKMRIVFILGILLVVELIVLYNKYDKEVLRERYRGRVEILEYDIGSLKENGQFQIEIANVGEPRQSIPNLSLKYGDERFWLEPVLQDPYTADSDAFMQLGIPLNTSMVITYEIEHYEEYKKDIRKADKLLLTDTYDEVLAELKL